MDIVIRRSGVVIEVAPADGSELPREIHDALKVFLQYQYRRQLRGSEAYDRVTGYRESVATELRNMYQIQGGKLVTCYGFIPRIFNTLRDLGHTPRLVDVSPPRERPDCYEEDWDRVRNWTSFRARQEECLTRIAQTVRVRGGGVVDATTGFGKTRMLAAIALLYPKAKIHVVCKPVDIVKSIVRDMTGALPSVGQIGGGQYNPNERVTVITADSLHKSDGDCDILLAEEAHMLMAPRYSEALGHLYRDSLNFAFTATPEGRFDGADAMLEMFFGPKIFELTYEQAAALNLVVPLRVRWLPIHMDYNPADGKTTTISKKRWAIWRNNARNAIIAEAANSYDDDHQVLVMVETIEHAVYLWQYMKDFQLCYGNMDPAELDKYKRAKMLPEDYRVVDAGARNAMRQAFEEARLHKVIATDVWSTGVNFEQLQTLVRADARDSDIMSTQIPGRASRIFDGKEFGELYDCVDRFDKNFYRKSMKRRRCYDRLGWEQDWPQARRQIDGTC